ncbi:MAG TPA: hypothetical protein PK778_00320 [Bacillota bacterium]|nr:hypothetical protein [Bacillota bacterium]
MMAEKKEGKNRKKLKARVELVKTVIIVMLFALMTVLASAEIVQTQLFSLRPEEDIDIASLLVLYGERQKSSITPYIFPEFLGFSAGGSSRGLFGGETVMRAMYGTLQKFMASLLADGLCTTLPDSEGEAAWEAAQAGDFVYLLYPHELPAAAIAYAVSEGETKLAEGDLPYIREAFIAPAGEGAWKIVSRSGSGKVSVFEPKPDSEPVFFDLSALTAYNNSRQLADFRFLGKTNPVFPPNETNSGENAGFAAQNSEGTAPEPDPAAALGSLYGLRDTTILVDGGFPQKYITVEAGAELTRRLLDSIAATELLGIFEINTERVAPYRSQGYTIYLGESGRVRFSDAGGIDYAAVASGAAGKGGVPVSSFLGYQNYGGRYTFFELLDAAASLLDKIESVSSDLIGGDAYPGLLSVTAKDGGIELTFGYFFDGYRIVGLGPAVKMAFYDGALVKLELTPARVAKGGACVSLPQSLAVMHLYKKVKEAPQPAGIAELTLAYSVAGMIEGDAAAPAAGTSPDTADEEWQPAEDALAIQGVGQAAVPAKPLISPDWLLLEIASVPAAGQRNVKNASALG